ncbi:hypothetical protein DTO195F2_5200 [Paecilomyces variotii]|nr:hypothetical protein DTO195F2_5200 [Paecilomyces variotii]KAJ9369249.1 hypothetical protein DTO282E5_6046 [Paecilomyces variotii]
MSYRERSDSYSHRSVTRSASPESRHHHRHQHHHASRSRSPERSSRRSRHHHHSHHRHRHDRHSEKARREAAPVELPFGARQLSKRDLPLFEPMFAMYLDIQKGIIMEDLTDEEVKGRWKSFIGKWNRGELAEGWYDPVTLEKARRSAAEEPLPSRDDAGWRRSSPDYDRASQDGRPRHTRDEREEDEDEDEDYGPKLPHPDMSVVSADRMMTGARPGPTIPNTQDLEIRRETAIADAIAAREDRQKQHRAEIRSHKAEMRHINDEVAPRAEPGTHERRMEKRREAAAANREFARTVRGGSPMEAAPEAELMGGDNDLDTLKKEREREQRKKNERELRREEMMRARAAEREERLQRYRQKEEETMGWLKALAKQRFG